MPRIIDPGEPGKASKPHPEQVRRMRRVMASAEFRRARTLIDAIDRLQVLLDAFGDEHADARGCACPLCEWLANGDDADPAYIFADLRALGQCLTALTGILRSELPGVFLRGES